MAKTGSNGSGPKRGIAVAVSVVALGKPHTDTKTTQGCKEI